MIANVSPEEIFNRYVDGVLDGSIITGKYIRLAAERWIRDINRQDTEEFPYYFDKKAANLFCRFSPAICRHSTGEWATKPIHLEPWQIFGQWQLFGWKRSTDHTRRFRRYIKTVARKNGKSTELAEICHAIGILDNEPNAQLLCTATKRDQAKDIIYREAGMMLSQSPTLSKYAREANSKISYSTCNGFLAPLGADKPFSGLNPHLAVFDELHEWKNHHRKFYGTMITGSGARRQPLFVIITTEGDEGSHIWIEERDYARKVLEGSVIDEELLALLYSIDAEDNWQDETCWIKANPNLGVSVKMETLRSLANQAKSKPTALQDFLRYYLNREVGSTVKPVKSEMWANCKGELSDWSEAELIAAAPDIGGRDDLGSVSFVARFLVSSMEDENGRTQNVYRYEVKQRSWLYTHTKRPINEAPFCDWIASGLIHLSEFVVSDMEKYILDHSEDMRFEGVAFDLYNTMQMGENFVRNGLVASEFRQTYSMYNEPCEHLQELIKTGRIKHDGDPVLAWAMSNMVFRKNSEGKIKPDKEKSEDKIDPAVSTIIALRIAMLAPPKVSTIFLG